MAATEKNRYIARLMGKKSRPGEAGSLMIFGELGLGDITKNPLGGVAGWVYCVKESVQIFIESSGFSIA
ncbi:hypothetical protein LH462_14565 [Laribacter hongkongensis]|uniref:Uncharacterized protein n=1 Tax=Laribacter hongkongensis TaxID=168471 RepID=A0ABD4SUR4_9NEIS|nr:hypothetical protein [Laribacter hongkongensis]MCG9026384.1 hypothetical protein [Laribacter hongkongensis]MCG9101316.1 hypothetical protein [Laribacter hongkongensis]MCG9104930.1 hypothetical protein [Laribacter hongkongensis]MCG9111893.1 hypothetical protein [Laribacter hongkongensis]MCG9118338.1 hypothetical protein [Laribacter hongkongensis]